MTGHLVHVGYPKTGSKFLQRWFACHPGIAFSHWGIAGFGNAHEMVTAAAGEPAKATWRVTSHEALLTPKAEIHDLGAGGCSLPTRGSQLAACAMLGSLFPSARILIVTRGYEALLRSFYAELVLGGAGHSFAEFGEALLAQVHAGTDPFDFGAAHDAYAAAFGRENVLVLPYELLDENPGEFLAALASWLGLAPWRFPAERVRPSAHNDRLATYRRLTRWVRAIPGPRRLRRQLALLHIAGLRAGRWNALAAVIERLSGSVDSSADRLPSGLIEAMSERRFSALVHAPYHRFSDRYLL